MKAKLKIVCTLTFLALSGQVLAQSAPSAVTGVTASGVGGEISVEWDAISSDPIAYYRVYYSGESILDNNGLYDDFEVTEGDETSLTFLPPLGMDMLYVAVIGVAQNGLESEFFIDEAIVDTTTAVAPLPVIAPPPPSIPEAPKPPKSSQPPVIDTPPPAQTGGATAKLLKGSVLTPESIRIEFSASMTVDSAEAPKSLKIEAPGGKKLQIKKITIEAKTITITTEIQERGTVYNVQFSEPFAGRAGQPLDRDDRSVLVTGHSNGKDPVAVAPPPPVRVADPMAPPDLQDITIVPELQANGAYTVTLRWTIDNTPGDLYGIVAYQTRDGQNFGQPNLLPIDISGVQLADVTPGFFGIYLQTVNTYRYVSPGVFQYVNLPMYIPGYGFYGDLTFGSMNAGDDVAFEEVDETEDASAFSKATADKEVHLTTLDAITDTTVTQPLEGVDHSAAFDASTLKINWRLMTLIASVVTVLVIVIVGYIALTSKRSGSME